MLTFYYNIIFTQRQISTNLQKCQICHFCGNCENLDCSLCTLKKRIFVGTLCNGDLLVTTWDMKIERTISHSWSSDSEQPEPFVKLSFKGPVKETKATFSDEKYDVDSEEFRPIPHEWVETEYDDAFWMGNAGGRKLRKIEDSWIGQTIKFTVKAAVVFYLGRILFRRLSK